MTGGNIRLRDVRPEHLEAVLDKLREAGAELSTGPDWIALNREGRQLNAIDIRTAPYPAFPTDMQAQFVALNCTAKGTATITESVFEIHARARAPTHGREYRNAR